MSYDLEGANSISECDIANGWFSSRKSQKIISKQHNIIGSRKSLTDAVVGGRHYHRNMRINKELFCVLVQRKGETLTKNINK